MKKIIAAIGLLLTSLSVFAELNRNGRNYVDLGFDVNTYIGQNIMGLSDVFVKDIVLDFTKLADTLGEDGIAISFDAGTKFNLDVCPVKNFGLGIFTNVEAYSVVSTGKGFVDFLSEGNKGGDDVSSTLTVDAQAFVNVGFTTHLWINQFRYTISPTVYVPVLFVPHSNIDFKLETNETNTVNAATSGCIDVYSATGIDDPEVDPVSIMSGAGFSLDFAAETRIYYDLSAGVYTSVPIVPGHLKYRNRTKVVANVTTGALLGVIDGDELDVQTDTDFEIGDTEDCDVFVMKPLKFGGQITYRPFGDWLALYAKAGFSFRNLFTEFYDAKYDFFPEFKLGTSVYSFKRKGPFIDLNMGFENKLWNAGGIIGLNFRVVEIDIGASIANTDFLSMWSMSGLRVNAGLHMGF